MFAQLQDILKAVDITDNSRRNRTPQSENYIKRLTSLSRYVTPCPDILDDVGCSNNNPLNRKDTSGVLNVQMSPGMSSNFTVKNSSRFSECSESSDVSDESAWESIQTPLHMAGQWKNLIEYETSLLANHVQQSMNTASHPMEQNSVSSNSSHQTPQVRTQSSIKVEDVVEVLNSIARSLEKLGGHSCENATDMFGQYIAHRLSEMSDENRSAAEIEINKVLMKYLAKDIQKEKASGQEIFGEDNQNSRYNAKKKK